MPHPSRSPNSDNEKRKVEKTEKENEKETETEGEMHLDPLPVTHGAPMDIDTDFFDVSDGDNDSNFGSEYDDIAEEVEENQVEENLIQIDSDSEPANTTGTNSPPFPSVPSASAIHPTPARGSTGTINRRPLDTSSSTTTIPPTQARGSTGTAIWDPLVPPSSTTTIPPTQNRGLAGSNFPHALAPPPIFPLSSAQARSSTGSDTSHPLARPSGSPTFATIAAQPQGKGSGSSSSRLSPAARGVGSWPMSLQLSEPKGPPPVYTPNPQPLCVVRNSRIASIVFISSLSVNADLQRETSL
jgi:hypothetical protein